MLDSLPVAVDSSKSEARREEMVAEVLGLQTKLLETTQRLAEVQTKNAGVAAEVAILQRFAAEAGVSSTGAGGGGGAAGGGDMGGRRA